MAVSSENQKWLIIGISLVTCVAIYAVSTRYVHTAPNLVLDKWTGEIHVSYHAQKSDFVPPEAVAKKEQKPFDPVAFLAEPDKPKTVPRSDNFVYIQDAQGIIRKVDDIPEGFEVELKPGEKFVPGP